MVHATSMTIMRVPMLVGSSQDSGNGWDKHEGKGGQAAKRMSCLHVLVVLGCLVSKRILRSSAMGTGDLMLQGGLTVCYEERISILQSR